ncbi:hypothetical protein FRC17_009426 [Serendipita sp. 399]|nr:hypothetical protein FRC17_009426 [Serendipita sp. 399]
MAAYERTPRTPRSASILKEDIEVQTPMDDLRFQDEKEKTIEEPLGRNAPTHKYSVHWWRRTWDGAVRGGKWPRFLYIGIGLIFLITWIAVMSSLIKTEMDHELRTSNGYSYTRGGHGELESDAVLLQGSLVNFNIEKRALTVTWSGLYVSDNKTAKLGDWDDEENSWIADDGIEVYRDVSAKPFVVDYMYQEETPNGIVNHTIPLVSYKVDNATAKPIGVIGMHPWDSFDTEITFTQRVPGNAWLQPLLGYPFDRWEGSIVFVANDVSFANFTNTTHGGVFGLSGIRLVDSTLNWQFDYEFNDTCTLSSNLNLTSPISEWPPRCHLEVTFLGQRPPLLIFCALVAVFVNWTCAIFIFTLTCEAIVMRRSYMLRGTDILSMCFTALFALPTIRALLPGAPAYGAIIDLVGILPCTLIVGLCAVSVAVAKLNKRSKDQKSE